MRKIRARTSLPTPLRPPTRLALETHVQYNRKPARCQPTTVLGTTRMRGPFQPDQSLFKTTQNSLCRAVSRRRGRLACNARTCWRRARFSRIRFSRELKALTTHPRRCRSNMIIAKNMARILSKHAASSHQPVSNSFILRVHQVLTRDTPGPEPDSSSCWTLLNLVGHK